MPIYETLPLVMAHQALVLALDGHTTEVQLCVHLRLMDGMEVPQIAVALRFSEAEVRGILARVRPWVKQFTPHWDDASHWS